MCFTNECRRIEGGVGGSIAPTAVSTLKRSGKMCARGVERGTNGTPCARVERNGTTQYKKKSHLMHFLHMVGMVLHLMQDLLFVVLNVEVNTAYTRNDRYEN